MCKAVQGGEAVPWVESLCSKKDVKLELALFSHHLRAIYKETFWSGIGWLHFHNLIFPRCYLKTILTGNLIEFAGAESGPKPCAGESCQAECDQYIWNLNIFVTNIYSDIRSYNFFYTNIFGHSDMSNLFVWIYSNICLWVY